MARRRAPTETQGSWIDDQVRRAREEGRFDDLSGQGRPLPDLGEATDPLWWPKALLRRERLSVVPPTLEIRGRVERALAALPAMARESEVRALLEGLNAEIREMNRLVREGPPTRQAPLDVERLLRQWRRERCEREPAGPGDGGA